MARHRSVKGRVVGLATVAGAFLAFGMAPLVSPPSARADGVEDVIDQVLAPFMDAATSSLDWDALLTPTAWDAFLDPAHWDAVFADLSALGDGAGPALSKPPDLTALFQQYVYTPIHEGVEGWINSSDPTPILDGLNQFSEAVGLGPMIADGGDGTAADPTGGDAGWLFGDGGAGYDGAGGAGGDAGIFGNGGAGGDGAADAAGGAGGAGGSLMGVGGDGGDGGAGGNGGDGGDGTGLFGVGGDGGDGANGVYSGPGDLPALGGAGGNGGVLGSHGEVGDHGTLTGAPPAGTDGLETTGTWLTDSDGRVVILHGVNDVYKIPPYEPSAGGFGDADAAFLAKNGVNAVRVGVIWAGVEPEPGVIDEAYLASIEQTVQTLADHGIVSFLDFHQDVYNEIFGGEGAPAWAVQTGDLPNPDFGFPANYFLNPAENHAWDAFWSNANASDGVGLENHYARTWEYVANYFDGNPDVAGYEIMNEPWPGSQWLSTLLGSPHFGADQLTPFYNQVDSAIRAVDPTTPVLFEPYPLFGNIATTTDLGTVHDPNTVFAFHTYCPTAYVLGGTSFGCSLAESLIQDGAEAYAKSHDIPAMITEWGNTDNTDTLTDTMNEANDKGFGWLFWDYGLLVHDLDQPPVGANVDTATLATLAEPYPQAVAGTPDSWSFDSGTFHLSYSTEMADGQGHFAAGAQTDISVPAIAYPNGYQVDVTGGHVVSAPTADDPVLVIASNAGANTVTVTVSPAAGGH